MYLCESVNFQRSMKMADTTEKFNIEGNKKYLHNNKKPIHEREHSSIKINEQGFF